MARKTKVRKTGTSKSSAKAQRPEAQLLEANSSVVMTIGDVAKVFKLMADRQILSGFIRAAGREFTGHHETEQLVCIGADTANFVKRFMAKKGTHNHPIGKHIINAKTPATAATPARTMTASPMESVAPATTSRRFRCNFGDAG